MKFIKKDKYINILPNKVLGIGIAIYIIVFNIYLFANKNQKSKKIKFKNIL